MDPISIIASSIAIATPITVGLQKIREARHAKSDLLMLANEVAEIVVLLQELQQIIVQQNGIAGRARPSAPLIQAVDAAKAKLEQLSNQISEWTGGAAQQGSKGTWALKSGGLRWLAMSSKVNSFKEDFRGIRSNLKAVILTLTVSGTTRVELSVQEVFVLARQTAKSQQIAHAELQSSLSRQREQIDAMTRNISQNTSVLGSVSSSTMNASVEDIQISNRETPQNDDYVRRFQHNGSVLLESAQMTAVAAVGIRTVQFPRTSCIPWCSCSCHKERRLRSPRILEQFIGSLFIGYSGIPVFRPPCNERSCHLQAQPLTYVTYFFPRWFLSRMVTLMMAMTPLAGPVVSLKVQRTVPGNADIFTYAKLGDFDKIKLLFEAGLASPHDVHAESGITPLHMAINHQHISTCRLLLQANADPFLSDHSQCTSADNAWTKILSKNLSPVDEQTLREMFSETECVERRELTVLHKVILGLTVKDLQRELAASTAEINTQEIIGRTPISMAAEKNDAAAVATLLRFGADPGISSYALVSPLHYAVCARDPDCARQLLEAGMAVNCITNWNQTPLIYAAAYTKDSRHAVLLLDAGAQPNIRDLDGMTALDWCAISNNPEVASVLLDRGCEIENIDNDGLSALYQCIKYNRHQLLKLLVERSPRIDACFPTHLSVGHIIAGSADQETIQLLTALDFSRVVMNNEDDSGRSGIEILMERPDYSLTLRHSFEALARAGMYPVAGGEQDVVDDEDMWEDALEHL